MLLMQILVVTLKVPADSALELPEFQTLPVFVMERCEVVHSFLFASFSADRRADKPKP